MEYSNKAYLMGTFSKSSEKEKDKATENLIKLPQGGEFIEILEEN